MFNFPINKTFHFPQGYQMLKKPKLWLTFLDSLEPFANILTLTLTPLTLKFCREFQALSFDEKTNRSIFFDRVAPQCMKHLPLSHEWVWGKSDDVDLALSFVAYVEWLVSSLE